jgi:hypothetical protein
VITTQGCRFSFFIVPTLVILLFGCIVYIGGGSLVGMRDEEKTAVLWTNSSLPVPKLTPNSFPLPFKLSVQSAYR